MRPDFRVLSQNFKAFLNICTLSFTSCLPLNKFAITVLFSFFFYYLVYTAAYPAYPVALSMADIVIYNCIVIIDEILSNR